ncbi:MAG: hypothetical protein CHACPFDD_02864 [Phycisphaerae bacterium]|nr:hypothetical protein [Phycisphaerae bacterium]
MFDTAEGGWVVWHSLLGCVSTLALSRFREVISLRLVEIARIGYLVI